MNLSLSKIVLFLLISTVTFGQLKVSELPAADTVGTGTTWLIVQTDTTKKVSYDTVAIFLMDRFTYDTDTNNVVDSSEVTVFADSSTYADTSNYAWDSDSLGGTHSSVYYKNTGGTVTGAMWYTTINGRLILPDFDVGFAADSEGQIAYDVSSDEVKVYNGASYDILQEALTFGIADQNSVVIDMVGVADNDYAKFTASGLEGRSFAEVRTDLALVVGTNVQAYDAGLLSLAGLSYSSPSFIKMTGADTYAIRTIAETKQDLALNLVENTAVSTWWGTSNIVTVGDIIANRTELTSGLASTDELLLSDAGVIKRMDVSVLDGYIDGSLTRYDLLGTVDQITVTGSGKVLDADMTLSLPQDINTTSSPTFVDMTLTGNLQQSNSKFHRGNFGGAGWAGSGFTLENNILTSGYSYLEIDYLTVRESMAIYELLIRQIRATNGNLLVTAGAVADSVSGSYIWFEDPSGNNVCPFATNDLIKAKRFDAALTQLRSIEATVSAISGRRATVSYTTGTAQKGDEFVRIGNTSNSARQGSILLSADDTNSPYMDIINDIDAFADWGVTANTKVRLGNLTGITDATFGALSGYGLYTENAYLTGSIKSIAGEIGGWTLAANSLSATNIWLENSAKYIAINSTTFGNDGIQLQYNAGNPRAYIGDGANAYFNFDGTKLTWKGANSELDASGNLILTDATITAGTIRTSSTAERIQIASDKISFFNDAEHEISMYNFDRSGDHWIQLIGGEGFYLDSNIDAVGYIDANNYEINGVEVISSGRILDVLSFQQAIYEKTEITTSATPSASGRSYLELNYGSSTTITDFTGGVTGQKLLIVKIGGAIPTITHGTNIFLRGATNYVMSTNKAIELVYTSTGVWVQNATN